MASSSIYAVVDIELGLYCRTAVVSKCLISSWVTIGKNKVNESFYHTVHFLKNLCCLFLWDGIVSQKYDLCSVSVVQILPLKKKSAYTELG